MRKCVPSLNGHDGSNLQAPDRSAAVRASLALVPFQCRPFLESKSKPETLLLTSSAFYPRKSLLLSVLISGKVLVAAASPRVSGFCSYAFRAATTLGIPCKSAVVITSSHPASRAFTLASVENPISITSQPPEPTASSAWGIRRL